MLYVVRKLSARCGSGFVFLFSSLGEERGGMLLYALVVLPVMLSAAVVAVDFSRFQSLRSELQKEADRIALQAAKSLPDTRLAANVVHAAAGESGLELARKPDGRRALDVSPSSISFTLYSEGVALFDLFLQAAHRDKKVFSISVSSSASLVPEDYVLIVSDALSLRPSPHRYWGDEGLWPKAPILSFLHPPHFLSTSSPQGSGRESESVWLSWWKDWESGYQRWVTQSCYNPVFSSIKAAAMSFARAVGRSPNRVGLVFTPGESPTRRFTSLRGVFPVGDGRERDTLWNAYVETDNFISDEACVLFAPPLGRAEPYQALAPETASCSTFDQSCLCEAELIVPSQVGGDYYPIGLFGACREALSVTMEEAIYYHAARNVPHSSSGENVTLAIREAYKGLAAKRAQAASGTKSLSRQKIVVFSDRIPDARSPLFQETVRWLEKAEIMLVMIPVVLEDVSGYPGPPKKAGEIINDYRSLKSEFVAVYPIQSISEASSALIPTLAFAGRQYVIRS